MLWLCICFPRLPFEALSLDDTTPVVVTISDGRTRKIVAGSKAMEAQGLSDGMDYATASLLFTQLKTFDRNPRAERQALERLAIWAYQWSSKIVLHAANPDSLTEVSTVWLEIAASFKLFGGREALLRSLESELKKLNYEYRLGIAYSLEGAALMARANWRIVADNEATLRRLLRKSPIALLALSDAVVFELERAGIRTVGIFLDLPRVAIARRFGPKVNSYVDRLLGYSADPRPIFQLPKKYRARCELAAEVDGTEALLFPLRRMLQELQGYLRAIDGGIQNFVLRLGHRQGTTRIAIGCSTPERDATVFFTLVRERFERLSLPAAVLEIRLQADAFVPAAIRQKEMFSVGSQSTEQFRAVLDKLIARLGPEAVQGCRLAADHRPESAWSACSPDTHSIGPTIDRPRPLWLFSEPRRIAAPAEHVDAERIESGWWDGNEAQRDYYFVRTANGAELWVYRDLKTQDWFLHGLKG